MNLQSVFKRPLNKICFETKLTYLITVDGFQTESGSRLDAVRLSLDARPVQSGRPSGSVWTPVRFSLDAVRFSLDAVR